MDHKLTISILILMVQVMVPTASAIDVDPRDYVAAPPGTNLSVLYTSHLSSRQGSDLEADIAIYRYVHYLDFLGMTVDPQFLIPYGKVELDSANIEAKGFADPAFAATFWLVNNAKTRNYVGITPFIIPPWGHYQRANPLTLGENRWRVVGQIGLVHGLSDQTYVELVADATIYGDNNDFGATDVTLEQDPSYQVQLLFSQNWRANVYFGTNLSYEKIGENEIADVAQNDQTETTKLSVYAVNWVTKQHQLQLKYSRDLHTDKAIETHQLQLRWLYVF